MLGGRSQDTVLLGPQTSGAETAGCDGHELGVRGSWALIPSIDLRSSSGLYMPQFSPLSNGDSTSTYLRGSCVVWMSYVNTPPSSVLGCGDLKGKEPCLRGLPNVPLTQMCHLLCSSRPTIVHPCSSVPCCSPRCPLLSLPLPSPSRHLPPQRLARPPQPTLTSFTHLRAPVCHASLSPSQPPSPRQVWSSASESPTPSGALGWVDGRRAVECSD